MSLNPLKWIEWLINEHGSSTILRERISLLEQKIVDLEKKVTVLEGEKINLIAKVTNLETENSKFKQDKENRQKMGDSIPRMAGKSTLY